MTIMNTLFLSLVLLSTPPSDDGFTTVFDGKDLSKLDTEGNWIIQEDGSLHLKPRPGEKGWQRYGSYLWLKGDYTDFVVDFEYKHPPRGNSGFYFRIGDTKDATASGFEVQILDCHGKEKLGQHDLGGVIKTAGPLVNASKPAGEWNRMVVTFEKGLLTVVLNGKTVQDKLNLAEKKPANKKLFETGKIAIQDHGQPFWVRNIRVKRLD